MGIIRLFTPAQRRVLQYLYDGFIIRRAGRGFIITNNDDSNPQRASIAVKSLAYPLANPYLASTGTQNGRIYFTSRGWNAYLHGIAPTKEQQVLIDRADARAAYVKRMIEKEG